MGWTVLIAGITSATVDPVTKKEQVYPTLYARRSKDITAFSAPPIGAGFGSNYGRMFTGVNIATCVSMAYNDIVNLLGGFQVDYYSGPKFNFISDWHKNVVAYNLNSAAGDPQLDTYLVLSAGTTTTTTEVLAVSGSPKELDLLDTTYQFVFTGSDLGFPIHSNGTSWDVAADPFQEFGPFTNTDMLVNYKTTPGIPILPQLVPRLVGATFVDFFFPVNVMTNESPATITLYWRHGTTTDKSSYDGKVIVDTSSRGGNPIYDTATATALTPNTPYTFWLDIVRDTKTDTTATGPVSYITTEASDTYTYDTTNALVSISTEPNSARFAFSLGITKSQRSRVLFIPATWIEAIDKDDYNAYGWADPYIHRSPKIGPFYPQQTFSSATISGSVIYIGQSRDAVDVSRTASTAAAVSGVVSGRVDVVDLVQNNAYYYRLALDWPSGREYPLTGDFTTQLYDPARQTISTRFTMGGF